MLHTRETVWRDRLAFGPFRDVRSQARGAAEERRAAGERSSGGKGRVWRSLSGPVVGGPPEMSWKIPVVDTQGNPAEIHVVPTRVEPSSVAIPVPNEWVNEAIRRMLAMENVIMRAASGPPLELRYPAPSPPRVQRAAAQRPQAQGQAVSRSKRTRSPPQKKMATRTPTPPVTTRRQTRSSQPAPASEEAARKAVARAELQYQIKMRERPVQEEG
ncbi:hypothetical protein RHMOL_Rhmol06G0114800 [Rhododendron molle]|uniref:Uncharacterized protein n=1 Tax=Rhododendron molle TaxID=49168 RepID=A0ACC0NCC3_RHOML|nr:hypothetical protein RHMOL_Rhmol06G0114800 [Rhododendron molle]